MSTRIDAFLSEVRNSQEFAAAVAADPKRYQDAEGALERSIAAVARRADENPAVVEIYDEILLTIGCRSRSTTEKLNALRKLLLHAYETINMKKVH